MTETQQEAELDEILRNSLTITALAAVGVLLSSVAASATADPGSPGTAEQACSAAASAALENGNFIAATTAFDFTCAAGEVTVTATGNDGTVTTLTEEVTDTSARSLNTQAQANTCTIAGAPTRTIVSELQVNMEFCVIYGQNEHPTNGSWARSIQTDWIAFPGFPSVQNRINVIPSDGSPTLTGTITVQQQRGIAPPSELVTARFIVSNGAPVTGFLVGGITEGGSHSVKMADLQVTDPTYGFDALVDTPDVVTPRFSCDTADQRCFYPNGQEAGL